jgi:hypothetical protein
VKSYFLIGTSGSQAAEAALDKLLPAQRRPWVLTGDAGDPIAYVDVEANGDVQADISGRHFDKDSAVRSLLEALQAKVSGHIEGDD